MGYEVDFIPVGDGSKSGDAIALRFGNLAGARDQYTVVVIDGGFKESGQKLVEHIYTYYQTDIVDIVIATHPHNDHIAGLEVVLEKMKVKQLWMHRPWYPSHVNNIAGWFADGRVTNKSISDNLRKSLETTKSLEKIALQKKIPITEPFVGVGEDFGYGRIDVAGPTEEFYERLLIEFSSTPEPKGEFVALLKEMYETTKTAVGKLFESWDIETLDDSGETNAENNSSVITLLRTDEQYILFTADAGIPALTNAVDLLESHGITHNNYAFVQVPHHGSKHNVGRTILNRLIGPKLPETHIGTKKMNSFCSCATRGEPKHPSKKVTNAFKRRGAYVFPTQGNIIWHYYGSPARSNYNSIIPLPFYSEVDDE